MPSTETDPERFADYCTMVTAGYFAITGIHLSVKKKLTRFMLRVDYEAGFTEAECLINRLPPIAAHWPVCAIKAVT